MKRQAFGAIDLLISLLVSSAIILIGINAIKGISSIKLNGSSVNQKSVEEQVDKQVEDIQNMRQQTIDFNNKMQQQENF